MRTLENMNKQGDNTLQGQDIVTFKKSLHLRWYKQVERMQKQDMPKQIAACAMEGIKQSVILHQRWKDEFKEDLNIMGTSTGMQPTRD